MFERRFSDEDFKRWLTPERGAIDWMREVKLCYAEIERQRALILEARWLEKNSYAHLNQESLNEFHKRREQWLKDVERGGDEHHNA